MDYNIVTKAYLAIRDRRAEIKREYEAQDDASGQSDGPARAPSYEQRTGRIGDLAARSALTIRGTCVGTAMPRGHHDAAPVFDRRACVRLDAPPRGALCRAGAADQPSGGAYFTPWVAVVAAAR